jgi:hypothetical protein
VGKPSAGPVEPLSVTPPPTVELPAEQPSLPLSSASPGATAVTAAPGELPDIDILDEPSELGALKSAPIELPPEEPEPGALKSAPIELPPEEPGPGALKPLPIELPPEEPLPGSLRSAPIELPPEPVGPSKTPPMELPPEMLTGGRTGARTQRYGVEDNEEPRWSWGLIIGGTLIALALLVVFTSPLWRRGSGSLPGADLATREEATALLRRDDMESREEAITKLRALTAKYPNNIPLQAELTVAFAMQLDDLRLETSILQKRAEQLRRDIIALEQTRKPADWQSRVNTLKDELRLLQSMQTPLGGKIATLMERLVQSERWLSTPRADDEPADTLARLQARSVVAAVMGLGETFNLVDRLKQERQDYWSALAMAQYVVNAPTPPDTLQKAFSALERVREQDGTNLRPFVLGARIALERKQPATAQALLDTVIALNPKHEVARTLRARASEELLTQEDERRRQEQANSPVPDFSAPPVDAGTSDSDAGTPPVDAGAQQDTALPIP